ncbi:LAME_0H00342g1_1 [Lachancea meyersii CBS 8951]|uniref:Pre-mRNA-splicing factor CWC22 n=1 Tax=Lachancea meyersii CBS 8951 TaxID=1266667 RepID=A0A1G4KD55_9SACH|nr:LAME_0H00342g1_1 [Lachancea meyersii CBS 8951]
MSKEERQDEDLQRENWERIRSNINFLVDDLDERLVLQTFHSLFSVNVILGSRLLVDALLQKAVKNNGSISSIAALSALVDAYVPSVGSLLVERAAARFLGCFKKNDARGCYAMASLISQLFNYGVAHEIVILQVLHLVTENLNPHSARLTIEIIRQCGCELLAVAKNAHDLVYEGLRTYFQDSKTSYDARREFEVIFELRKRDYRGTPPKIHLPPYEPSRHTYLIDPDQIEVESNTKIVDFVHDPDFATKEEEFGAIQTRVNLLETSPESLPQEPPKDVKIHDMTQSQNLEFKKKVYLTLKGSLSGDEAAHKLLKLRVPDRDKKVVVDTLVMACSQETTYSKFYGVTAERLCSSHRSWQFAFASSFKDGYVLIDDFQAAQVRNMGKLWGHILASDYVGLEVLEVVHMNAEETTSAGRVYLKFLLQELVLDLGIQELKKRLEEPCIQSYLTEMFPVDDVDKTRFSINFFTAIGLGSLTETMRETLKGETLTIQDGGQETNTREFEEAGGAERDDEDQTSTTWEKFNRMRKSRNPNVDDNSVPRDSRRRSRTPPRRRRSRTPTRRRSRSPQARR